MGNAVMAQDYQFEADKLKAKARQDEHDTIWGQIGESKEGMIARSGAASIEATKKIINKKEEQAKRDRDFVTLMMTLRDNLIEELAIQERESRGVLIEKYGTEDLLQAIYKEQFQEEMLNEEQAYQRLKDLYLDEDGEIKPEYKDLDEAIWIKNTETLRNAEYIAKHGTLEEQIELVNSTDIVGKVRLASSTDNDEARNHADNAIRIQDQQDTKKASDYAGQEDAFAAKLKGVPTSAFQAVASGEENAATFSEMAPTTEANGFGFETVAAPGTPKNG